MDFYKQVLNLGRHENHYLFIKQKWSQSYALLMLVNAVLMISAHPLWLLTLVHLSQIMR